MFSKVIKAIIMGAPGSGKGTVSNRIVKDFSIKHLSSGDLLRTQILQETELGLSAKRYIDQGKLVPDGVMIKLFLSAIHIQGDINWLLDGFPRTLNQAVALHTVEPVNFVINLDVPFDIIIERIKGRRIHLASGRIYHTEFNPPKVPGIDDVTKEPLVQRDDDKPDTVKKRLETYSKLTNPVLDYYRNNGLLTEFSGKSTPEIWPKVREFLSTKIEPIKAAAYN